jgi:hypothetical protein
MANPHEGTNKKQEEGPQTPKCSLIPTSHSLVLSPADPSLLCLIGHRPAITQCRCAIKQECMQPIMPMQPSLPYNNDPLPRLAPSRGSGVQAAMYLNYTRSENCSQNALRLLAPLAPL